MAPLALKSPIARPAVVDSCLDCSGCRQRGSIHKYGGPLGEDGTQVHLLSAFLHGQWATIAQKENARKTNEIPELRSLLKDVDIQDKVVTADALHTQRETARFLVEDQKADYLFTAVKGNQRKLRNRLACLPWGDFPPQRRND